MWCNPCAKSTTDSRQSGCWDVYDSQMSLNIIVGAELMTQSGWLRFGKCQEPKCPLHTWGMDEFQPISYSSSAPQAHLRGRTFAVGIHNIQLWFCKKESLDAAIDLEAHDNKCTLETVRSPPQRSMLETLLGQWVESKDMYDVKQASIFWW